MAYTVIRRYKVDRANVDEILRRGEEGFAPLISRAPGFVRYRMAQTDDGVQTVSTFETRAQAEESVGMAAGWVKANLASLVPNPPEVVGGEVRIQKISGSEPPRHGVMRVYRGVTDVDEAVRRAEAGLVPIIAGLPGFVSYTVLDAGGGTVVSLSGFRDREAAARSTQEAAAWVRQNLAELMPNPPEVSTAEIRVSKTR